MQKSLILILARDLADKLASAVFVVDHEGSLVYFNETAEEILGQSFADVGQMRMEQWSTAFAAMDADGRQLSPEELPLVTAIHELRPSHRTFRIKGMDGALRDIAVTAMPLFAQPEELVGAMALFWEHGPGPTPDPSGAMG
jgi:PAS domain S-box-containing protein